MEPLGSASGGLSVEETAPLLRPPRDSDDAATTSSLAKGRSNRAIAGLVLVAILVGSASYGAFNIPATRLVEDILCREHYGRSGPVDEAMCKVDSIQADVAFLFAMYFTTRSLVGIVTTLPWCAAMDKVGSRAIVTLSVSASVLEQVCFALFCRFPAVLPIRLAWLSPMAVALGGGVPTVMAGMLALFVDISPESSRGTWFLGIHVAAMVGNLLSPTLSGGLAERFGPWPSLMLGLGLMALSAAIFFIAFPAQSRSRQLRLDHSSSEEGRQSGDVDTRLSWKAETRRALGRAKATVTELLALLRPPSLAILLGTMLVEMPINSCTWQFLNQFASKRFRIPLAQTGYLLSAYGLASIFVALVVLPAAGTWLLKMPFTASLEEEEPRPMDATTTAASAPPMPTSHLSRESRRVGKRDLVMTQASHLAIVAGAVLLAVAPTVATFIGGLLVLSLGAGFNTYSKSLMVLYVGEARRTRLYSLVGIAEEIGSLYAQPFLAGLFTAGMKLDRERGDGGEGDEVAAWIGLPYFGVAGLAALAFGALMFVRVPRDSPR